MEYVDAGPLQVSTLVLAHMISEFCGKCIVFDIANGNKIMYGICSLL